MKAMWPLAWHPGYYNIDRAIALKNLWPSNSLVRLRYLRYLTLTHISWHKILKGSTTLASPTNPPECSIAELQWLFRSLPLLYGREVKNSQQSPPYTAKSNRYPGKPVKKLPEEISLPNNGPTSELYNRLAFSTGTSIHRLRITKGSDGSFVPNNKDLSVNSTGLREQSTIYVKDLGPQIAWRTVFLGNPTH